MLSSAHKSIDGWQMNFSVDRMHHHNANAGACLLLTHIPAMHARKFISCTFFSLLLSLSLISSDVCLCTFNKIYSNCLIARRENIYTTSTSIRPQLNWNNTFIFAFYCWTWYKLRVQYVNMATRNAIHTSRLNKMQCEVASLRTQASNKSFNCDQQNEELRETNKRERERGRRKTSAATWLPHFLIMKFSARWINVLYRCIGLPLLLCIDFFSSLFFTASSIVCDSNWQFVRLCSLQFWLHLNRLSTVSFNPYCQHKFYSLSARSNQQLTQQQKASVVFLHFIISVLNVKDFVVAQSTFYSLDFNWKQRQKIGI